MNRTQHEKVPGAPRLITCISHASCSFLYTYHLTLRSVIPVFLPSSFQSFVPLFQYFPFPYATCPLPFVLCAPYTMFPLPHVPLYSPSAKPSLVHCALPCWCSTAHSRNTSSPSRTSTLLGRILNRWCCPPHSATTHTD